MGDLDWVRLFFPQTSGDRIFFCNIQGCKIFSPGIQAIFFVGYFFPQVFPCEIFFFPQTQSAGYFFLQSPLPPSKVKWSAPKDQCALEWIEYLKCP